ncbi:MAG: hypothetical protein K0R39_2258 [Symbiobacteriaceae bacterium]|jgi:hypothetical protein|nr:hypothetical protein [Symbiobacteriaceae bacterium]
MIVKKNHTKATMSLPTAGKTTPRPTEDEIIEEILRAAGLEALG